MTKIQIIEQGIRSVLAARDRELAFLNTIEKVHAQAVSDLTDIEAKIAKIGAPDYRDRGALDSLESLGRQRGACEQAITKYEEQLARRGQIVNGFSSAGFLAVQGLLLDACEAIVAKAAAQFQQYYATPERALHFAQRTDAAISAKRFIDSLKDIAESLTHREHNDAQPVADQIEKLLQEALKDRPDFQSFFRPYRDSRTHVV